MDAAGILVIFVVFAALAIGVWFLTHSVDKDRITSYVEERGGRVVSISWAPFGKGWFGEKNDRIYEVVYYDRDGNQHFATCKTSFWAGVYWTDDRVTHRKSRWYSSLTPSNEPGRPLIGQIDPDEDFADEPADEPLREPRPVAPSSENIQAQRPSADLLDELRRLRAENERLKKQLDQRERA